MADASKKFNEEYTNGSSHEQVKNFMTKEMKIFKNTEEISSYFPAQVNVSTSYVPVDCSSMPIICERKELPNWSGFITTLRENNFNREAKACRTKTLLEMPFKNAQKSENETFFEFSLHCYSLLKKIEITLGNKINEVIISKKIFHKIYEELLETDDMMDTFYSYYKNSNNIITACQKFDEYLKRTNCDHLITIL